MISSCSQNNNTPKNGDLLFCVSDISQMSKAITDATYNGDSLQFDHVAIFSYINEEPFVIEASANKGVSITKLEDFLKSCNTINGKPGVIIKRLDLDVDTETIIERALTYVGQPYDWSYLPNNNKLYCSELIYECYRNNDSCNIFQTKPMNFRNKDGEIPDFWKTLFDKSGEKIPEGVPGTNPNDIFKDKRLQEIYRYF